MQCLPSKSEAVSLQWQDHPISAHPSVRWLPLLHDVCLPITRYLSSVENRLQRLERLVAQRLPDVNIDEALESLDSDESNRVHQGSPLATHPQSVQALPSTPNDAGGSSISEAVPEGPDGFDWQEDVNELADGMAALSVEPKGTGYLGKFLSTVSQPISDSQPVTRVYGGSFLSSVSVVLYRQPEVNF